ncbi:AAA family ATPase [Pedobacter sp. SD-b]|uniref:AAA family ATPase n=1 Tax=Pedobacter segetis TaxID=2793069 RepID=A0ABS1BFR8_9SPHI|nr:helix-turn-helix domain-containing protein [Pedobacter segetis]MBK0381673.1 AAA family ATPase [Pedobacter segetis]
METNPQLQLAHQFVQNTNRNIFLTGKAGTGKTTFLHHLRTDCPKRIVVVAPTGVAAINAKGSTIHSFFHMPFGPYVAASVNKEVAKNNPVRKMNRDKVNLIKGLDLLVIDEISMVRADTLDGIDEVLRRYKDRTKPFGGVQLLMIGDLHQLSPVVKDDDWAILKDYYPNLYFFNSKALQESNPVGIELKHIYRQSDTYFIDILNAVRENTIDKETLEKLNQRYIPNFNPSEDEGYITLSSHNHSANAINERKLKEISTKEYTFTAEVSGDFPEYSYPNAFELILKVGAQVMFVKNDSNREKLFYNGKIGKITRIKDELIFVKCPDDLQEIAVGKAVWENIKPELNTDTKAIEEIIQGTFMQYPLKLAWAITIHKSQGLTFEKAIIDANAAFAHGQVYVALSRCKSFEGMVLSSPISFGSVKTDGTVATYTKSAKENEPTEQHLTASKIAYQQSLLFDLFDFNPIKTDLFHVKKLAEENHHTISFGFIDNLNTAREQSENSIYAVADKFKRQMNTQLQEQSLPEENTDLQDRVKKGCIYFNDNLSVLEKQLEEISFDADNKSIKKLITEAQEQLKKEIFIKKSSLDLCKNGFKVLSYLKNKANAEIDFLQSQKEQKAAKPTKVNAPRGVLHPELYQTIKNWRDDLAAETGLPVYQILPQKTLTDIVNQIPANFEELESIKGIGKVKIKQYGNEILTMVSDYCDKKELSRTPFQKLIDVKKDKTDTKTITYNLFIEGKSIKEIAEIRALTVGTIEGHLGHFITTQDLVPKDFMDADKVDLIAKFIEENNPKGTNDVKVALPDDISYNEIRAVMNYLKIKE